MPDADYLDCRWNTLRKPLGLDRDAAILGDDVSAIHAFIEAREVVSVGRAHLIPPDGDGSMADHEGKSAATCPAFQPLTGEVGFPSPTELRPSFHIRQMGTRLEERRRGHAAKVLSALEGAAVEEWSCRSGWLQARIRAIPFYESQGWTPFGDEYHIDGIGPHKSMWKTFGG